MTFGGMGSKKLEGGNIEYIANNDSHPGAQFSSQFRNLVKGEIAKFTAEDRVEIAQANAPKPIRFAQPQAVSALSYAEEQPARPQNDVAVKAQPAIADAKAPRLTKPAKPAADVAQTQTQPRQQPPEVMAFLDKLSGSVHSGDLFSERLLTVDAMKRYAEHTYHGSPTAELVRTASD
jgi:hypothetical protein